MRFHIEDLPNKKITPKHKHSLLSLLLCWLLKFAIFDSILVDVRRQLMFGAKNALMMIVWCNALELCLDMAGVLASPRRTRDTSERGDYLRATSSGQLVYWDGVGSLNGLIIRSSTVYNIYIVILLPDGILTNVYVVQINRIRQPYG